MSTELYLTPEQTRQINDIYIGIVKKYRCCSSESVLLDTVQRIDMDEAQKLAEAELGDRQLKIEMEYTDRCNEIEQNAVKRGMQSSNVTMELLDRAYQKKTDAVARLQGMIDKLAKRIHSDNQKLALAAEKEKSATRSRALRDYLSAAKHKLTIQYNTQSLIDEEVYAAYLMWFLQFTPDTAYRYCNDNVVFLLNLGSTKYTQLRTELNTRRNAQ